MFRKFGVLLLAACACQAQAKVDEAQAARLGQDLTPLGAERAGSANGSIPAWTGGVQPPTGYRVGMHHPDPYAADPLLYRVDGSNAAQYAALLPCCPRGCGRCWSATRISACGSSLHGAVPRRHSVSMTKPAPTPFPPS